jgi:hypothetical protein
MRFGQNFRTAFPEISNEPRAFVNARPRIWGRAWSLAVLIRDPAIAGHESINRRCDDSNFLSEQRMLQAIACVSPSRSAPYEHTHPDHESGLQVLVT